MEVKAALSEYVKIGRSISSECALFHVGIAVARIPMSQTHESSKTFPQGEAKVNAKAVLAIPSLCVIHDKCAEGLDFLRVAAVPTEQVQPALWSRLLCVSALFSFLGTLVRSSPSFVHLAAFDQGFSPWRWRRRRNICWLWTYKTLVLRSSYCFCNQWPSTAPS